MRYGKPKDTRRYRLRLFLPYALVFVVAGVTGFRLITASGAEPLPAGSVVLTVSKPTYAVGETVRFNLRNGLDTPINLVNNCPGQPLEVYRHVSGSWQRLEASTDESKCVNEPRSYKIAPHSESGATYRFWPSLFDPPGHYRLEAPLEAYDSKPSVEFDVVAP